MRPLLERIVEKTRSPQAGAASALMPLVAPLYAPSSNISQASGLEKRNSEQDGLDAESPVHSADSQDQVASSARRPAAIAATTHGNSAEQTVLRRSDADEVTLPRAIRRSAPQPAASSKTGTARSVEPLANAKSSELPEPQPSAGRRTARPDTVSRNANLPFNSSKPAPLAWEKAQPTPMGPLVGKAILAHPQAAAFEKEARVSPQVTVSIGHIEVRAAQPQSTDRPRRPEFRPSLSLSEFLKPSGGGRP
jgi:hypothetical protein